MTLNPFATKSRAINRLRPSFPWRNFDGMIAAVCNHHEKIPETGTQRPFFKMPKERMQPGFRKNKDTGFLRSQEWQDIKQGKPCGYRRRDRVRIFINSWFYFVFE
jgi:hypothetical protein